MASFDDIRLATFIVAAIVAVVASWRSLANVRSHGFSRFVAWVTIAGLIVWNMPSWFSEPFSVFQLASWIFLSASLIVLWLGVARLRTARRSSRRDERELYAFERTAELVTSGIYHYIRHPLYASLLFLAWGAFLKDISWLSFLLVVVASGSLFRTATADENECLTYFGEPYRQYMTHTKRFIPYVF